MEVKFKVQHSDDIMEMCVGNRTTIREFICEAQRACPDLVPHQAIRNICVHRRSCILPDNFQLSSVHPNEFLVIKWEECDPAIGRLCQMGFPRDKVIASLKSAKNHILNALETLKSLPVTEPDCTVPPDWAIGVPPSINYKTKPIFPCTTSRIIPSKNRKFAADIGSSNCRYNYAICLFLGIGVEADEVTGAEYLKLAADDGLAEAQLDYSYCLHHGRGVSADAAAAVRYCRLAADQGLPRAQYQFAVFASTTSSSSARDVSAYYFKLAAEQGIPEAQYSYSVYLHEGIGVTVDETMAAYYAKLAADHDIAEAQNNYGCFLGDGIGIPPDKEMAMYYFKLAADHGMAEGQCNYASYLRLRGAVDEAARYMKLAADNGLREAQYDYGKYLMQGIGVPKNPSLAEHYYRLADANRKPKA